MPGASFESVEGDAFTGNVKIKLGPINLSYRGRARCVTETADLVIGTGPSSSGPATE